MKQITYIIITGLIWVIVVWAWIIWHWYFQEQKEQELDKQNLENVEYTISYLTKNYESSYPMPEWDLILLDDWMNQIHLEDRTKSLDEVDDLYVIQWTTCWINTEDEEFINNNHDVRFSTWANQRCFSYSVTNDQNDFQIGYISYDWMTTVANLTGTTADSITRSYNSKRLVSNKDNSSLPYMPSMSDKIEVRLLSWEGEITIKEDSTQIQESLIQEKFDEDWYIQLPMGRNVDEVDLSMNWDSFVYEIVYPNGNKQTISPNSEWKASLKIQDFEYDWKDSAFAILDNVWRVAYDFVKLGWDSNYNITDNNNWALVIRWTQFTLDSDQEKTLTHLSKWSIEYILDWKEHVVDLWNNIFGFDNAFNLLNVFELWDSFSNLLWYSIAVDLMEHWKQDFQYKSKEQDEKLSAPIKWFLPKDAEIVLKDNYELDFDDNSQKNLLVFSWNFSPEFVNNVVWDRKYVNNVLKDVCLENWFEQIWNLNDWYRFLEKEQLTSSSITFDLNNSTKEIIPSNYDLIFEQQWRNNSHITYYNTRTNYIDHWHAAYKYDDSDSRDWFWIVCY